MNDTKFQREHIAGLLVPNNSTVLVEPRLYTTGALDALEPKLYAFESTPLPATTKVDEND